MKISKQNIHDWTPYTHPPLEEVVPHLKFNVPETRSSTYSTNIVCDVDVSTWTAHLQLCRQLTCSLIQLCELCIYSCWDVSQLVGWTHITVTSTTPNDQPMNTGHHHSALPPRIMSMVVTPPASSTTYVRQPHCCQSNSSSASQRSIACRYQRVTVVDEFGTLTHPLYASSCYWFLVRIAVIAAPTCLTYQVTGGFGWRIHLKGNSGPNPPVNQTLPYGPPPPIEKHRLKRISVKAKRNKNLSSLKLPHPIYCGTEPSVQPRITSHQAKTIVFNKTTTTGPCVVRMSAPLTPVTFLTISTASPFWFQ